MTSQRERVGVLSASWGRPHDETAFAMREIAAALSRTSAVDVLVPGPPGSTPDGAFDLLGVGVARTGGRWPAPRTARVPFDAPYAAVVVEGDHEALSLAENLLPEVPRVVVAPDGAGAPDAGDTTVRLAVGMGAGPPGGHRVGLHVPVNPLAAQHRHNGLGQTGYLLVLSDRGPSAAGTARPAPLVSWLAARFPRTCLVAVENAVASVWRSRALRGRLTVDSRTDLWRLVAHAGCTVDLRPGPLFARECVESLRYGVPVIVPSQSAARPLAALGGGLWFADVADLLGCVDALDDPRLRDTLGRQGRAVAEEWYGSPVAFVERVAEAVRASAAASA